jgi:hypothetical protein
MVLELETVKLQSKVIGISKMRVKYLYAGVQVVTLLVAGRARHGLTVQEALSDRNPGPVMSSEESHIYHSLFIGTHHLGRPEGESL